MAQLSRDNFIAALIAELQEQKQSATFDTGKSLPYTPREVYEKLCFDFPMVSCDDLVTLEASLAGVLGSSGSDVDMLALKPKFLENLLFLSSSTRASEDDKFRKAAATLSATVFIKLPAYLLSCRLMQLQSLFPQAEDDDEDDAAAAVATAPAGRSWAQICSCFKDFVKSGNASIIVGDVSLKAEGHTTALCSLIRDLEALLQGGEASSSSSSSAAASSVAAAASHDASLTLAQYLQQRRDEQAETIKATCVHYVFFARDIVVALPDHLESLLPPISQILLAASSSSSSTSSEPSANQCLYALFCSSIAASLRADITSSSSSSSSSSGSTSSATGGGAGGARSEVGSEEQVTRYQAEQARSEAKMALKSYLDQGQTLSQLVDICQIMQRSNRDGAALLSDIISLYLSSSTRRTFTASAAASSRVPLHDRLIVSRALPLLIEVFVKASAVSSTSALQQVRGDGGGGGGGGGAASLEEACSCFPQIVEVLTLACFQSALVGQYVLRFPSFAPSLKASIDAWLPNEERPLSLLTPKLAIAFLISLLFSAREGIATGDSQVAMHQAHYAELRAFLLKALAMSFSATETLTANDEKKSKTEENSMGAEGADDDAAVEVSLSSMMTMTVEPKSAVRQMSPLEILAPLTLLCSQALGGSAALRVVVAGDGELSVLMKKWAQAVQQKIPLHSSNPKWLDAVRALKALQSFLSDGGNKTD